MNDPINRVDPNGLQNTVMDWLGDAKDWIDDKTKQINKSISENINLTGWLDDKVEVEKGETTVGTVVNGSRKMREVTNAGTKVGDVASSVNPTSGMVENFLSYFEQVFSMSTDRAEVNLKNGKEEQDILNHPMLKTYKSCNTGKN